MCFCLSFVLEEVYLQRVLNWLVIYLGGKLYLFVNSPNILIKMLFNIGARNINFCPLRFIVRHLRCSAIFKCTFLRAIGYIFLLSNFPANVLCLLFKL